MGITIHKILEKIENYSIVELSHGTESFIAKVWNENNKLNNKIGKENIIVEMNYDKLISISLIEEFDDFDSKISRNKNIFNIKGRVSNIIKMGNDSLVDIYLQTGPEFLSILQSEIGDTKLKINQGVKLEISNLRFFPT